MKILQINKLYYPHLGGVETVVKQIGDGLGTDVLVCASGLKSRVEKIGSSTVYRASSWGRIFSLPISFQFFFWFRKLIKEYDVLLIHEPFPLATLAAFFWGRKKKTFIFYHSDIVRQRFLACLLRPFLLGNLKRARKILVSSANLIKYSSIISRFPEKCVVLPFGLNMEECRLSDSLAAQVSELQKKYGRFALAVGRLVPYKGFSFLLSALADIDVRVLLIGSGRLKKKLQAQALSLKLGERLVFLDSVSDLRPYYLAGDFFVFPSISPNEAFGLVQLEAMAFSRPVINTDLRSGVPEVSLDGVSGITIVPQDSAALTQAMEKLWRDEDLRKKLGQGAKERVQQKFTEEKFIQSLNEIISA